jgi:hypothetical protein
MVMFSANASSWFHFPSAGTNFSQQSLANEIVNRTQGLSPRVVTLALTAYDKLHAKGYDPQQMLTIVDYTKPSTQPRLWVINLKTLQVPLYELVAHGENSGGNFATTFSDDPRSLESSIGVYLTGNTYIGKHGYSLHLDGLDPGFNDRAANREIVVHAANYVSDQFAALHGRLGRSWGCFAVSPAVSDAVIGDIKDGTVLFAYYPDQNWLHRSAYLQA